VLNVGIWRSVFDPNRKGTKIYNRPTALPCRHEKTAIIDATRGATFANRSLRNRAAMTCCELYIWKI
jgi:hypothetical protein